jgi:uncharacterized membrane protein YagU involved in acid resistance
MARASEDATIRAGERISYVFRATRITPRHRHLAGVTVHNVFRALFGTAYGFAFEANPEVATGSGLPLGAAVWLLAEELALPVTGLSRGVFVLIQRRNYFYHEYYPARIG